MDLGLNKTTHLTATRLKPIADQDQITTIEHTFLNIHVKTALSASRTMILNL